MRSGCVLPRPWQASRGTGPKIQCDEAGRVVKVDHLDALDASIERFEYTYNTDNQKVEVEEYGADTGSDYAGVDYDYDTLHRLTSETRTLVAGQASQLVVSKDYQYDEGGNIQRMYDVLNYPENVYRDYVYDTEDANWANKNRLIRWQMSNDTTDKAEFDYDTAGNIETKTVYVNGVEQEETAYGYRKDNLLDQVQVGENDAVTYTYDILGRRIAMMVDNVQYQFDYDGDTLLVERGGADLKRSYLQGLGLIWEKDHTQQGAPVAYHYADAHGSTRMLGDADGDPIARANYDAWGATLDGSDAVGRFSYAGEWGYKSDSSGYGDAVTGGIMQCGVRYYDPDIGRFLQAEPRVGLRFTSQSLNRYVYCEGDSPDLVDPRGLSGQQDDPFPDPVGFGVGLANAGIGDAAAGYAGNVPGKGAGAAPGCAIGGALMTVMEGACLLAEALGAIYHWYGDVKSMENHGTDTDWLDRNF